MPKDIGTIVCTAVGFQISDRWSPLPRLVRLGAVIAPDHPDGYFLCFGAWASTRGCCGGARTVQGAIDLIREKHGFPAYLPNRFDGNITRI